MAVITGLIPQYLRTYPFLANNKCYRFDGFLSGSKCIEELSLMVRTGNVVGTAIKTKLVFRPDSRLTIDPDATVPHIYLGKLSNYAPYSIDQTLLVVIPGRTVGKGNTVCAFWQRSHGSTKVNVDHVTLKMTNVEKVADYVSFRFAHRNDYFTFDAIVGLTRGLKETAGQQHLTVAITTPHFSTGSLLLELRDLRPSPSGRQPRGVNDSASCPTTAINDTYKITTGSQNDGSVLMRSLVEMSSKIVELTNKPNEKFNDPKQTVRDRDGMSAQLESKLRAKQGENKLLKTMLLESLRALEEGRRTAQETKNKLRGVAKWKCLIPCK